MKFAILGHGVVGSGVAELFFKNKTLMEKRCGQELELKYILDLRDFSHLPYGGKFTNSIKTILEDDEIGVVAECMGGLEPAFEFVKSCLECGKSVTTSNKELISEKGDVLIKIAKKMNCQLLFEASVGGAIPIIRPITKCLSANEFLEINGILNGTTNYILTKMESDGSTFGDALADAQAKGFAERNPAADVDGVDACRKIAILASLTFGMHIYPKYIYTQGISDVTLEDVKIAAKKGMRIKLIANAKKLKNGKIQLSVMPTLVTEKSPFYNVDDCLNLISVSTSAALTLTFSGAGAGKLTTASAVLGDLCEIARHTHNDPGVSWDSEKNIENFIEDFKTEKVLTAEINGKKFPIIE